MNKIALKVPFFTIISCFTLLSCKENSLIPSNIVPAIDNITVFGTDTLTLNTKTVLYDSINTSAYFSGSPVFVGAGNIQSDPVFGKTNCSFYFQIRQPQDNYTFDKSKYQIDSAILVLPFSGYCYGDTTLSAGVQIFNAYRMTESIYYDSAYYASTPLKNTELNPFATATVSISSLISSYYDSTLVGNIKYPSQLRLKVDNTLMNELVDKSGGADYVNTQTFLSYFKGIYVKSETPANSIPYFRLTGNDMFSKAGIMLYYHTINSNGSITDTLKVLYPYDPDASQTKTAYFGKIQRDFSGSQIQSLTSSVQLSDPVVALQSQPGASLEITIPYVKNLPKCVVNKAELVINQIGSPFDELFLSPNRIYPMILEENGTLRQVTDREPLTSTTALYFIDGNKRLSMVDGKLTNQYVLNFPRELQRAIVEQKNNLKLRINGIQTFAGAHRVVLAGGNYTQPALRAKLNVVYTKL